MKSAGHALLRLALTLITGTKKKQRLIVFGVRRSGNHAFTNWLANAVEEAEAELTALGDHPPLSHAFSSPNGAVIHLNEINELDVKSTFRLALQARSLTRKCQWLIISFEDVRPSAYPNFRRLPGREIHIWRGALEIISSRYHNLHKKANSGIGWSRQSCDAYFLDTLREFQRASPRQGLQVWNYNLWLNSAEYRRSFLQELGLTHDQVPKHSDVGGGSSFHGTSGHLEADLGLRLRKVKPQGPWVNFLTNLMASHTDLFTKQETAAGKDFIQDGPTD